MQAKNKNKNKNKNKKLPAKAAPVVVAPSSDTADSLRVVTQGLSALLTQIKIDRQNARRRVLTPEEKTLRGVRAKAAIPGLQTEIGDLKKTLEKFATVEKYKKYIEEQKVEAKKEKDKTKYQDAAESKFESGDFIGGMLFKFLGRNEPKKGDLKKEEEEKQLIEERLKLQDKLYGLQEREAKLQRLAGVAATPTPIAPEAPATAPEAANPVVPATPAATAEAAANPAAQIKEERTRDNAEVAQLETQNQTTIIQRTSDGIDKLWTTPINVNANVTDFSDPALKKLVTKLKDEGIGTGGGSSPFSIPLPGIGGPISKVASKDGGSFLSKVSKVGKAAPIISGVLTAGLGLMQGDSVAKAGSKGVGSTVGSIAGAALFSELGPVGIYVGALIGGILGDILGGLFGDFLNNLGKIFTMKSGGQPPDEPQKPPQVGQKNNVTLDELNKSGLNIKSGAMKEGGTVSENVKVGANRIMNSTQLGSRSTPNQITSLNDDLHTEFEHPKGNAFDFTVVGDKPTPEEGQAIIKQIMANDPNVIKVIDEYNNPSENSTGGHFHVEYKSDKPKVEAAAKTVVPASAPAKATAEPVVPASAPAKATAEPVVPASAPAKAAEKTVVPAPAAEAAEKPEVPASAPEATAKPEAASDGPPAAPAAPTKQNMEERPTGISPTPSPDLEALKHMNGILNAQDIINENKKLRDDAIAMAASQFPATALAPSYIDQGSQKANQLYSKSIQTDMIKDQAQQVQSVVVLQDNSVKSSTTSLQKEARDHFLPMPNYFLGYFSL